MTQQLWIRYVVKADTSEIVEEGLELLSLNYEAKNCNRSRVQINKYGEAGYHAFFEVYKERSSPKLVDFMPRSPEK